MGSGMGGGLPAAAGMGSADGTTGQKTEDIYKILIPNKRDTGIPNPGTIFPEMEYICYVMSGKTHRLLDVELYPSIPVGVATDIKVNGEGYGRGLCGRNLPDVQVFNEKKRFALQADQIVSGTPVGLLGETVGAIGKKANFKPWEIIKMQMGGKLQPLFDPTGMARAKEIYEDERLNVRRGMLQDKLEVELQDRMTLGEFVQRRDGLQSMFVPMASSIYDNMVLPQFKSVLNYQYLTGRLPPPPIDVFLNNLRLEIELVSSFSYGQDSEKGTNIMRALAPFELAINADPTILNHINFNTALRSNFAHFELSDLLNTPEEAERNAKLQAMLSGKQKQGQPQGAEKGRQKAAEETAKQQSLHANEVVDSGDYSGLG